MARLIEQQVAKDQTVMMHEIGQIGYLSGRRVIDTHGLIHELDDSEVFNNLGALVQRFQPDFFLNLGWLRDDSSDYREQVRRGRSRRTFTLPTGEEVTYTQVAYCEVGTTHMPVLFKRERTFKGEG